MVDVPVNGEEASEEQQAGSDEASEEQQPGSDAPRRRRWPWVVGIAAVVLVGGGAWAFNAVLGGGGPQPAEALPAGVDAYFRIDLDPSPGQKLAARELAGRFPALEDVADDLEGDLRRVIYDLVAEQDPDFAADVDFDEDLAPWLGDRVGVGLILDDPDVPVALVAVQVTDADAAAEALPRLFDEEDVGLVAYAFAGDYVVFAEDQATADRAVAAAADESLADNELFTEVHEGLGDPGVASMWLGADLDEVFGTSFTAQGTGEIEAAPAGFTGAAAEPELGEFTMAAALRLDADHIELAGQALLDTGSLGDVATGVGADLDAAATLGRLPATTLLGLTFAGVDLTAEQRQEAWDQMMSGPAGSGFDPDQMAEDLEESFGLALPDDLFDLLSNDITLALDAAVLEGEDPLGPEGFSAAVVFDLAGESGEQAVVKLMGLIEESGVGLAVDNDGERAIISLSESYLDELTGATEVELLSDTGAAARALGTEGPVSAAFYLDAGGLTDFAADGDGVTGTVPDDVLANLEAIEAVGVTAWQEGRGDAVPMGRFSLRVTLED